MRAYEAWWWLTKTSVTWAELRDIPRDVRADVMEVDRRMSRAARTRQERESKR